MHLKRRSIGWLLPVALIGFNLPAMGQVAFPSCPNDAFITRGTPTTNTSLYALNLADGAMTVQGAADTDMQNVNGIGFRSQDGFIWGWNNAVNRLARIGQNGVTTVLGASPAGFTPGPDFFIADVQPSTGYYVGHDGTGNTLYFFNVTTNTLVRTVPNVTALASTTDSAFHPTNGMIYSVNSNGDLIRVDPTNGATTTIAAALLPTTETTGGFGGIFFDNQGTLYGYKSGSGSANGLSIACSMPPAVRPLTIACRAL